MQMINLLNSNSLAAAFIARRGLPDLQERRDAPAPEACVAPADKAAHPVAMDSPDSPDR